MVDRFVPETWQKASLDAVSSRSFLAEHLERQRLGPEVGFGGEWDAVVFPDGTEFNGTEMSFDGMLDGLTAYGRKVVKREVPDEAAQDDFQTLLAKWRDEGKYEIADRVEDLQDDYGTTASALLVSWVDEVVTREAPVSECKFYLSSRSRPYEGRVAAKGDVVSIPKIGDIYVNRADIMRELGIEDDIPLTLEELTLPGDDPHVE